MAFDVYVGTMTRFYRREWENVVQRVAREQGIEYEMVYGGGKPEEPPAAEEIRQAVEGWCQALSGGLAEHGYGPMKWDEGEEKPYFTDRPGWDGYGALLVWAAHAEHPDLPLPVDVPESWLDDVAYQRSTKEGFKTRYRTILEAQLWLPVEFPFTFAAPTMVSEETSRIGSTFTLKQQLEDLYSQTGDLLAKQKGAESKPVLEKKKKSFWGRVKGGKEKVRYEMEDPETGLAENAEFGLKIFLELATKACEYRLPILLHY